METIRSAPDSCDHGHIFLPMYKCIEKNGSGSTLLHGWLLFVLVHMKQGVLATVYYCGVVVL